jgi:hypothetical protein
MRGGGRLQTRARRWVPDCSPERHGKEENARARREQEQGEQCSRQVPAIVGPRLL